MAAFRTFYTLQIGYARGTSLLFGQIVFCTVNSCFFFFSFFARYL